MVRWEKKKAERGRKMCIFENLSTENDSNDCSPAKH